MNLNETMKLIKQIMITRPMFLINKTEDEILELAEEWTKVKLQYYDYEDVMNEYSKFMGEITNINSIPDPFLLTRNIVKKEDKNKQILGNTACTICKRTMPYIYVREHENRCRSIKYINNVCKTYFGRELKQDTKELLELDEKNFDKIYKAVLEKAYPMMEDTPLYKEKTLVGRVLGYEQ